MRSMRLSTLQQRLVRLPPRLLGQRAGGVTGPAVLFLCSQVLKGSVMGTDASAAFLVAQSVIAGLVGARSWVSDAGSAFGLGATKASPLGDRIRAVTDAGAKEGALVASLGWLVGAFVNQSPLETHTGPVIDVLANSGTVALASAVGAVSGAVIEVGRGLIPTTKKRRKSSLRLVVSRSTEGGDAA
ncbi:MAG: hypothetical protein ACKVPX_09795 [Myxococcaceae bacterium]